MYTNDMTTAADVFISIKRKRECMIGNIIDIFKKN